MEDVIDFLKGLLGEKPEKEDLINRAIIACAAYEPRCHKCKWHTNEEWFFGLQSPKPFGVRRDIWL